MRRCAASVTRCGTWLAAVGPCARGFVPPPPPGSPAGAAPGAEVRWGGGVSPSAGPPPPPPAAPAPPAADGPVTLAPRLSPADTAEALLPQLPPAVAALAAELLAAVPEGARRPLPVVAAGLSEEVLEALDCSIRQAVETRFPALLAIGSSGGVHQLSRRRHPIIAAEVLAAVAAPDGCHRALLIARATRSLLGPTGAAELSDVNAVGKAMNRVLAELTPGWVRTRHAPHRANDLPERIAEALGSADSSAVPALLSSPDVVVISKDAPREKAPSVVAPIAPNVPPAVRAFPSFLVPLTPETAAVLHAQLTVVLSSGSPDATAPTPPPSTGAEGPELSTWLNDLVKAHGLIDSVEVLTVEDWAPRADAQGGPLGPDGLPMPLTSDLPLAEDPNAFDPSVEVPPAGDGPRRTFFRVLLLFAHSVQCDEAFAQWRQQEHDRDRLARWMDANRLVSLRGLIERGVLQCLTTRDVQQLVMAFAEFDYRPGADGGFVRFIVAQQYRHVPVDRSLEDLDRETEELRAARKAAPSHRKFRITRKLMDLRTKRLRKMHPLSHPLQDPAVLAMLCFDLLPEDTPLVFEDLWSMMPPEARLGANLSEGFFFRFPHLFIVFDSGIDPVVKCLQRATVPMPKIREAESFTRAEVIEAVLCPFEHAEKDGRATTFSFVAGRLPANLQAAIKLRYGSIEKLFAAHPEIFVMCTEEETAEAGGASCYLAPNVNATIDRKSIRLGYTLQ